MSTSKVVGRYFYPCSSLLRIWLIIWSHIPWGTMSTCLASTLLSALHHYSETRVSTQIFCTRSIWTTIMVWPRSPNTSPNIGHAADRAYTDSALVLSISTILWPTPSCSHSTDWRVFLQLRFPWTYFYLQVKLRRMKLFLLHHRNEENKPVVLTIVNYLGISPPVSEWMHG